MPLGALHCFRSKVASKDTMGERLNEYNRDLLFSADSLSLEKS